MKIKIISLNLWQGGKLFPEIVEFLQHQQADIIALQEVYDGRDSGLADNYRSMERLTEHLRYPYSNFAQGYTESLPQGKVPHGNAVLTKFPIAKHKLIQMTGPAKEDFEYKDIPEHWPLLPSPLQHVQLVASESHTINVFNMHGVWDLDGDNYSAKRKQMSEMIITETSQVPNVIVTGDSNAKSSNKAMRDIEAHLKPVFGQELSTTFNMRRKTNPGYAIAAVDLMYVSSEFYVLSYECPDVDVSDHLPLVVSLELP
jgi:endonuclease/exonuclease/phosphatase family metal-dependent hydrolase